MTAISKLVVQMDAENAKLHRKLEQSQKKLKRFSKTTNESLKALKQFGKVGATAVASLTVSLGYLTKEILQTADRVGKLSVATGISTEALSQYGFAAELTGSNFESLVKGFTKLQRSMNDVTDGLSTQVRAFDQLGVVVTDNEGNLRDTDQVIGDVADAFKGMEDGAKKGALAQIIFGRAGRDMIPFLNQGREGIEAMRKEADALGITMGGDLTAAAEETNDNLYRLSQAFRGVLLRVLKPLLPKIVETTKAMVAWAKEGDNVAKAMQFVTNFGKSMLTIFYLVKGVLEAVAFAAASLAAGFVAAIQGDFSRAVDIIKMGAEDSDKAWSDATSRVSELWEKTASDIKNNSESTSKDIASPMVLAEDRINDSVDGVDNAMKKLRSKFTKGIEDAKKFAEEINKDFAQRSQKLQQGDNGQSSSVLDVSLLELQAKQALKQGDLDSAAEKAKQAFDVLQQIKDAGAESNLVLEGMAAKLRAVGQQIGEEKMAAIGAEIQFDLEEAQKQAKKVNDVMQAYIDQNPIIQKIVLEQGDTLSNTVSDDLKAGYSQQAINAVKESKTALPDIQPITLELPGGGVLENFYGDSASIDQARRDLQREALKMGTR
jgi:tetratricopeptide (TPR) repeat protein